MYYIKKVKRKYFPRGIRRDLLRSWNRIFKRVSYNWLVKKMRELDLSDGSVICLHGMLSGLGLEGWRRVE